jgi:hypothetical protein
MMKRSLLTIAGVSLLTAATGSMAEDTIDPPLFEATLAPGESVSVEKTVTLSESLPKLDVCLLVDLSGSYGNDLPNIKAQMPGIWDTVKEGINDVRWCLASFVDFPFSPWGSSYSGDYAYRLDQGLTPSKDTWMAKVNAMVTRNGGDFPESQYEALFEMATGQGNDIPPAGSSLGDVPAGQNPMWRNDATKVIIITTDASFHNAGDSGSFSYPGPSAANTIAALQDNGIKVIALKAPGSTSQMDDLANATGGSVQSTTSTSSDIGQAILDAFAELTFNVAGAPSEACQPLNISLNPEAYPNVAGGESVVFDEIIEVPSDISDTESVECTVAFSKDDTIIEGGQTVHINVQRNVTIVIKPDDEPTPINLAKKKGVVPVAVLGSADFDASTIDDSTLRFGHYGTEQVITHKKAHPDDINGDGYMDLVSHYDLDGTGILVGDTEACLSGKTSDGIYFKGCDTIRVMHGE